MLPSERNKVPPMVALIAVISLLVTISYIIVAVWNTIHGCSNC
jgi:hypothetical protein